MVGGEAPQAVFRRLLCAAAEDVGTADPNAMLQVIGAWDAFERVGWPEGKLFMAQAICYVAAAPKSNASYVAFSAGARPRGAHRASASTPECPERANADDAADGVS